MANIKVRDLADTTTISSDNQIMVLTNDPINLVQNITVGNFNQNIISTDADNGIEQGSDGGLYVDNADSGVTAGIYQYPQNLVVNEKGQITSVESASPAAVPIATTSQAGIVKPDGSTITVLSDGTISAAVAASRNIGEIVASTIPLTDAGLHLLDGTQLSGDGIYSAFVDYIGDLYDSGDYDDIFETEANWQTAVTTYGVCGKFVYTAASGNDPATVRLPLIEGFTEATIDPTELGALTQAGLPNITGSTYSRSPVIGSSGAFSYDGSVYNHYSSDVGGTSNYLNFDASRSSSIYGNSNTVQPQSIKVLYYIVVATSTKTDIQVDIDEITTDLNAKVDKSQLVETDVVIEMYQSDTSWYRLYNSGWCEQGGRIVNSTDGGTSVALLKPYRDTSYTITTSGYITTNTGTASNNGAAKVAATYSNITTTGFILYKQSTQPQADWRTGGYVS